MAVPPDPGKLRLMNAALAHRGPDGEGIEVLGPVGLAHRRLAIIDLSEAGHQPMATRDRRLWLTYNGEIYNYLELRKDLEAAGAKFFSNTDSEVILHAYRAWGEEAFALFNGIWALGIWDAERRELILSRDRFGVKPLYLHQSSARIVFASEVKAILAAEPELARLDRQRVADFLSLPLVDADRKTYFEGVECFEPGTLMRINAAGERCVRRYWTFTPPRTPLDVSSDQASDKVRALLVDAVRLEFRSDVPVGTCLSGGLDSSSIVAIARSLLGIAPETFSAIYDEPGFEEREFVDLMVRELDLSSNRVEPDASDLGEVLERCTYFQEEPTAAPGLYSQWHVMRIASEKVTVLLDGQGGDEVFGGYFHYFDGYARSLLQRAKRLDAQAILEALDAAPRIESLIGRNPFKTELKRRMKARVRGLRARAAPLEPFIRALPRPFGEFGASAALTGARGEANFSALRGDALPEKPTRRQALAPTGDPLTDQMWDQLIRSSIPGLLHFEDRNSMAFSIEARVPFLDHRLVEYAFQLPTREKIRGDQTKVVLRAGMRGILPERVRQRRDKKGYPTPLTVWLKQRAHQDWALDLLSSQRTQERGLVEVGAARRLWERHFAGAADHSWMLWQLLTLELFCRRYVDGPFRAEAERPRARKIVAAG